MARLVLILAACAALLDALAQPAAACSCVPFTKPELAAGSEVIFTGVALSATLQANPFTAFVADRRVEFQVSAAYKGEPVRRISVEVAGGGGASCGVEFDLGRSYTVFARDHDSDGIPNTNLCLQNVSGEIDPAEYGLAPPKRAERDDVTALVLPLGLLASFAGLAVALERGSA